MIWYWIAGIMFAIALVIMIANFVRDRIYMRKKTSQTFSPGLKNEVEREREEGLARRNRFEEAMNKAKTTQEQRTGEHRGPTA